MPSKIAMNTSIKSTILAFSLILIQGSLLSASIRIHRTDKLGENSTTSPIFDHTEARAEAKIVFAELAEKHGWEFTQSSDSEIFTDEGLKEIDVIILDNNTGILFNESERRAFENWVKNGGGVVGIHGATHAHKGVNENNEAEWPFWYGLWGVLHKTGPKEGPQGRRGYPDQIYLINASEPWCKNLPKQWVFEKVEWYFWNYHKNFSDKEIIAIATVKANQPDLPEYYPVTWCQRYEGGKVWYTNMGHYAENFRQEAFIQHLLDGINWAANKNNKEQP